MSFRHTVSLCAAALAAALISQFALAGSPPAASGPLLKSRPTTEQVPTPVVQEIGLVEGVVDFCTKADPADKAQIERKAKELLPKMSEDKLEAVRRRTEYHAGYGFIQTILKGLTKSDATRNCAAIR